MSRCTAKTLRRAASTSSRFGERPAACECGFQACPTALDWRLTWPRCRPMVHMSPPTAAARRRAVTNHLASRHPDLKPLLLLHIGRTKSPQVGTAVQPCKQRCLQTRLVLFWACQLLQEQRVLAFQACISGPSLPDGRCPAAPRTPGAPARIRGPAEAAG